MPTVRTSLAAGEPLTLKVILLSAEPLREVTLYHRPLGASEPYQQLALEHVGRGVYSVTVAASAEDYEYFIQAQGSDGTQFVWPATAPQLNQTVVIAATD